MLEELLGLGFCFQKILSDLLTRHVKHIFPVDVILDSTLSIILSVLIFTSSVSIVKQSKLKRTVMLASFHPSRWLISISLLEALLIGLWVANLLLFDCLLIIVLVIIEFPLRMSSVSVFVSKVSSILTMLFFYTSFHI